MSISSVNRSYRFMSVFVQGKSWRSRMTDIYTIEKYLGLLYEWIGYAGEALTSFFIDGERGFWRDTLSISSSIRKSASATSTSRSFFALYEYLRFLEEENQ